MKAGTILQKLLTDMTQEDLDNYMSYTVGETPPPAGALEICALADLMLSDIEIHTHTHTHLCDRLVVKCFLPDLWPLLEHDCEAKRTKCRP